MFEKIKTTNTVMIFLQLSKITNQLTTFIMSKKLLLLLFLLTNYVIKAQSPPQIIPPAPNAAALAQYADIPVSKYTGVPNISIPIYTINSGGFQLPVSISYHASGIKAQQEASSVGLGWALNAGGVITRQIRGIDDFSSLSYKVGFLAAPVLPAYGATMPNINPGTCAMTYPTFAMGDLEPFIKVSCRANTYDALGFILKLGGIEADYVADTESDLYSFNFGSYSGKFVVNKDGSTILYTPESGVTIKVINTNSWQATTPDGVIYKFTKKEYTRPYSYTSQNANLEKVHGGNASFDYISSWFLTDILLTNGENITLSYTDLNTESRNYGSIIVNRAEQIAGHVTCDLDNDNIITYNNQYTKSSSTNTIECFLNKIAWNEGYIDFSYLDRIDIESQVSIATKRLNSISVKKIDGSEISNAQFYHSYFNSQASNDIYKFLSLRLKLDSFKIDDKNYSFNYLNPNSLPKKYSNSTDHWGYFNNEANLSPEIQGTYQVPYYIPKLFVRDTYLSPTPKLYEGAKRDCNPTVMMNGILSSIQYPTKGLLSFEYEPNDFQIAVSSNTSYGLLSYEDAYDNASFSVTNPAVASVCSGCYAPATNPTFTLTKTTKVNVEFKYSPYGSQIPPVPVDGNGNGTVFGSIVRIDSPTYSKNYNFVPGFPGKTISEEIELTPGTYRISVSSNYSFSTSASAKFAIEKALPATKRIVGGGLRIKKIISAQNTRIFDYSQENDTSKTSGLLMLEPNYGSIAYDMFHCFPVFLRESNPIHGLSDSGNTVGYSFVKESITDGIDTSITTNKFKNRIEFKPKGSNLPVMPAFDNGLLLEESYQKNIQTFYKKTYEYENALVKRYELYNTYFLRLNFAFGYYINYAFYKIMPEWWRIKSETVQNYFYDQIGTQKIVASQTDYDYNINNFKVNKITTLNSEGKSVVQKITYPCDYTSSIYTGMVNKNFTNTPIETITLVDGKVTKAKLNTFKEVQLFPDGEVQTRFVPEFEYAFKSVNSPTESAFVKYNGLSADLSNYQEVLNYNMYNLRGDPLQITAYGTQKYTYLWGYNQNHPVAKIDNATYNDVIALPGFNSTITAGLSETQDTTLRTGLPNAMITTYTYQPLFGVSTITDPKGDTTTYTYDNFGRLEFVKDNKGNILTENQYHYKP